MCNFFSFLSDANGNYYYADDILRKKILRKEIDMEQDSHSSLAKYFLKNGAEDRIFVFATVFFRPP